MVLLSFILYNLILLVHSQCINPRMRKEIRQLNPIELDELVQAMRTLHNTPSAYDRRYSMHEIYSKLHNENHLIAHGTPLFLPWHRYFIRLYEMDLQRINPNVMLPYWDWSLDAQAPHNSIILSDMYFGSNGNKYDNYCVRDGRFANMYVKYDRPHCLQRNYDLNETLSVFAIPEIIVPFLNIKSFSQFSDNLEQIHADPHNNIGNGKDFSLSISPNDPLFYLHHAFLDLLWYNWQQKNPLSNPFEGSTYNTKVDLNSALVSWNHKSVKHTFVTTQDIFCYTYPSYPSASKYSNTLRRAYTPLNQPNNDTLQTNTTIVAPKNLKGSTILDEENKDLTIPELIQKYKATIQPKTFNFGKTKLKKRKSIPEQWIIMNHLNLTKVRTNECLLNQWVDVLNSLLDFKPLSNS